MISIENLFFQYFGEGKPILDGVSLEIKANEFLVISGDSGSGKSTLALAMCGYLFQQEKGEISGIIRIGNQDISSVPFSEVARDVFLVQQNPENQFCTLTVQDEIAFGLENLAMPKLEMEERIEMALRSVMAIDLLHRDLRTLSGGEQQKVAIATAVALKPKVIILDEPTSNLDGPSTENVINVLNELRQNKELTLVVIEHKLDFLLDFATKLVLLEKGKVRTRTILYRGHSKSNPSGGLKKPKIDAFVDPLIDIENGIIFRQGNNILSIDRLIVYPGEFISAVGHNGAGKTSLLYALTGLIEIQAKRKQIFGKEIKKVKPGNISGEIGLVFQNPDHQFFADSVYGEIIFPINNFLAAPKIDLEWVEKIMRTFKLDHLREKHPLKLSYGQKKRLSIASALSNKPKLLLLDEIFIGQSYEEITSILDMICLFIGEFSSAVILVNHLPDVVHLFASREISIERGTIASDLVLQAGEVSSGLKYDTRGDYAH